MAREKYTPIFEDQDYETILARMLNKISNEFDKREGSIIFDAHAPSAIEIAVLYSYLDFILKNAFGNTANRYWLIQRAKERGIEPYPATRATVIGKFNQDVGAGKNFHVDGVYYRSVRFVEEHDGLYFYELLADESGEVGNIKAGKLTSTETIRGLTLSEIDRLAILGQEEEETEKFRERYFEAIKTNAYGGNIDDYRKKVTAIDGVGQVKVVPVWSGGGTVKIIITDTKNGVPTKELIAKVQEILDPAPLNQKGIGVAPIGHYVTVVGAKKKPIDLNLSLMIDKDKEEIIEDIKNVVEEYLAKGRTKWSDLEEKDLKIYGDNNIRLTKIMSLILSVSGVIDYEKIEFKDTEEKILQLEEDEIPFIGDIDFKEVIIE